MKKAIATLIILICLSQPVLAGIDPYEVGSNMVTNGIANVFTKTADSIFTMGFNATSQEMNLHEDYGFTVNIIYLMATIVYNPLDNPFVKNTMVYTSIIGLFLIIFYIFLGAAHVSLNSFTSERHMRFSQVLSSRYHLPINEYGVTILETFLMMIFGYFIIYISIEMEAVFTKLLMFPVLDRIAPTGSNVVMYFMMSICYLLIALAIGYRLLIISLFCAGFLIFVGMYAFGVTRDTAIAIFWYFEKMLFMRTIIVGITVLGIYIITSLKGALNPDSNVLLGIGISIQLEPLMYLSLILILVITTIKLIFGIKSIFGAAYKIIRVSRYVL